jgi:DNA topoisomerase-6 subunit B
LQWRLILYYVPFKNAGVQVESEQTQTNSDKVKSRVTAESLATRQRDISISEFFSKNRHLLGFDNPQKALLTAIKKRLITL